MGKIEVEKFLNIIEQKYNLHINFDVILVTGTSGKTTTSHYINLILQNSTNLKIGLFSKPHITNITERIRINYVPIKENQLEQIQSFVKSINQEHNLNFSWFDELVSIAIIYFIKEKIDLAIFEIGIGGLKDSTNALKSIINVITNIGLEHTDILGKTIKEIAQQKAGIIKNKSIVVTNATKGLKQIKEKAKQTNSKIYKPTNFFKIEKINSQFPSYTYKIKLKTETWKTDLFNKKELTLKFNTYYLVENFLIALTTSLLYCQEKKINTRFDNLQNCVDSMDVKLKTQIFEYYDKKIIIDTAKDYQSLLKLFKELFTRINQKFAVILSFSKGKELKLIKKLLLNLLEKNIKLYLSEHSIEEKKLNPYHLKEKLIEKSKKMEEKEKLKNLQIITPLSQIEEEIKKIEEQIIVITGSLYFCAEIYNNLLNKRPENFQVAK